MLTGHYGNWELLGFALATLGFEVTAVMRPLDNEYLNSFLLDRRERSGLRLLYKKGATKSAGDVIDGGGALCFIADQNAGSKGLFVQVDRAVGDGASRADRCGLRQAHESAIRVRGVHEPSDSAARMGESARRIDVDYQRILAGDGGFCSCGAGAIFVDSSAMEVAAEGRASGDGRCDLIAPLRAAS